MEEKGQSGTFISGMNATQIVQDPLTAILAGLGLVLHAYAMQYR